MNTNHQSGIPVRRWYRIAVSCFFFIQGLVFSSWASRIPDIKNALQMSDAQLGGVLFCIPVGQLTAMGLSGYLVGRYGSRTMLTIGALVYPAVLVWLGFAFTIAQLCIGLVLFGMAANLCNISVNTQGVGVERLYGRSIMGSFHGLWSLAGFAGGLVSTLMVGLSVPPYYHFCLIYTLALLVVIGMRTRTLPRDLDRKAKVAVNIGRNVHYVEAGEREGQSVVRKLYDRARGFRPERLIILLGVISFGVMICEGTMFEWSAVYFEQVVGPPRNLIRLGYIVSMLAMASGRFTADRLITRFGYVGVLQASGVLIFCGLILAVAVPTLVPATIGFMLVGLGVASVVPICYSLAGRSSSMKPGAALAAVSTIGFLGFLLGPPVIGFVAGALNLRWSLGIISIVGLTSTFLAPKLNKYLK